MAFCLHTFNNSLFHTVCLFVLFSALLFSCCCHKCNYIGECLGWLFGSDGRYLMIYHMSALGLCKNRCSPAALFALGFGFLFCLFLHVYANINTISF